MRKDFLVFDGLNSLDYGLILAGPETADATQRDETPEQIPGRSGDLLLDNGRYLNQTLKYNAAIVHDFEQCFAAWKTALLSRPGYRRLEDSIHPEEFRLASFTGPILPKTTPHNRAGEFELAFNCKPQHYLKIGERPVGLGASGAVMRNPGLPALPLIRVEGSGSGTLTIDGVTVTFLSGFKGPVLLDCETQNAYYGVENKNSMISAVPFPTLPSGECGVYWTGGVTTVEITPRWWTL